MTETHFIKRRKDRNFPLKESSRLKRGAFTPRLLSEFDTKATESIIDLMEKDLEQRLDKIDQTLGRMFTVFVSRDDLISVSQELVGLREQVQLLVTSIDALVKSVDDLKIEYTTITYQMSRHERWIMKLAEKIGVELEA